MLHDTLSQHNLRQLQATAGAATSPLAKPSAAATHIISEIRHQHSMQQACKFWCVYDALWNMPACVKASCDTSDHTLGIHSRTPCATCIRPGSQ
jgi:hypothetical protein